MFSLNIINESYYDYISKFDSRVLYSTGNKNTRPHLGIVLEIDDLNYFAPLSSTKKKHKNMNNSIDFIKIDNANLGVINLNNMIPVHKNALHKIDIDKYLSGNAYDKNYGHLLLKQLAWCNIKSNREQITKNAKTLHKIIVSGKAPKKLAERTCDFLKLEKACRQYELNKKEQEIDELER